MKTKKELEKFHKKIKKNIRCSLCGPGKMKVIGEGSPNAKIMFIAEAPGREEEKTGRPFVGRAGKLLNGLLREINLQRKEVYITSAVKCRPPQNRRPKTPEIKDCLPWLEKQIDFINPKLIVLLGSIAFGAIFEKPGKISEFHGKIIEKEKRRYFITFHPAAALRFPIKVKKLIRKDFKKLKKYAKNHNRK